MRILRIKQAEHALADGRLDEACEIALDADLRSHRSGQKLVGRLAKALVARALRHGEAGHDREALADCEKAERLAGNLPEVADLREKITRRRSQKQRSERRRGELVTAAREHIEEGRLSFGEEMLADCDESSAGRAEQLRREAANRRTAAEAALARATAALDRDDCPAAIDALLSARARHAADDELADLTARALDAATARARQELLRGRLDLAESLLSRLRPLAGASAEVEDLSGVVHQCRRAWQLIQAGELRAAGEALRLARSMAPEAKWLREAIDQADRAAGSAEALRSGALAALPPEPPEAPEAPGAPDHKTDTAPPVLTPAGAAAPAETAGETGGDLLPRRFLLQVDGAGSYLVVRAARVTIGPISHAAMPQVGLMADPSVPVVTIERSEGDYFLRSDTPVSVNDSPATSRLLVDGDRIALSPRCRLRFRRPNAASGSAVLELTGTRLPHADARRVILLDREVLLGPGPSAHVRSSHLRDKAMLYVRAGRLLCRAGEPVTLNRKPLPASSGIPVGAPVRLGAVGLVVSRI